MPKTNPSRPSYTELGLISLVEHMKSRIERLEDMVNEHGVPKKDSAVDCISKEQVRPLVEAIRVYVHEHGPGDCGSCNERMKNALAHASRLGL